MATSKITIVHDEVRNFVVNLTGLGDTLGQENKLIKVPQRAKIHYIDFTVTGGYVNLYWGALDPVLIGSLSNYQDIDYRRMGGLKNPTDGNTILLSTVGFSIGSSYNIMISMVKKKHKKVYP